MAIPQAGLLDPEIEAGPSALAGSEGAVEVSVVVVSWNSAQWIGRCLRSIASAAGSLRYEVFVWDNASMDASAELARTAADDRTRVIASPTNRGFAGAINDLASRLRGRYLFLLNPDCAAEPGSIETLARFLDGEPVAGVAPMLVGEDGRSQRAFQLRRFPTLASILAEVLLLEKIHPSNRASRRYRYGDLDVSTPQAVQQPAAAALMLRREAFERIGPLDERFRPAWFEDVDYCRRLELAGDRLVFLPQARVVHHGGSTVAALGFDEFLSLWYRNLYLYAQKWMKAGEVEAIRWGVLAGMSLRLAAALVGLHPDAASRARAMRAYRRVMREAFRRWDATSRSF